MAMPIHAMTLPALSVPTRAKPHVTAPVMMKLSATPSTARPPSRIETDAAGMLTKASDTA